MSVYVVQEHIRWCDVDKGLVVLDLRRQKYFSLPASAAGLFHKVLESSETGEGALDPEVQAAADSFCRSGFIRLQAQRPATPQVVLKSCKAHIPFIRPDIPPKIRAHHVLRFIYACVKAYFSLRFFSLENIVIHASNSSGPGQQTHMESESIVIDLVQISRRLRMMLYTAHKKCLFDSLVLLYFLHGYGMRAIWIVGISTRPFGAHSWLQHETLLLNDTVDHVAAFTPILVS